MRENQNRLPNIDALSELRSDQNRLRCRKSLLRFFTASVAFVLFAVAAGCTVGSNEPEPEPDDGSDAFVAGPARSGTVYSQYNCGQASVSIWNQSPWWADVYVYGGGQYLGKVWGGAGSFTGQSPITFYSSEPVAFDRSGYCAQGQGDGGGIWGETCSRWGDTGSSCTCWCYETYNGVPIRFTGAYGCGDDGSC